MPGTGMEAWRYFCKSQHQEGYKKLNENWDNKKARKIDEADHINGKFSDDEEYPGNELEKGAWGEQSSAYIK